MKTSVIEIRDMLSVLSVDGVEERIGKVGGVESVTVNYAAGNATVRYDETRLDIADIKSTVRQGGYDDDGAPPGEPIAPGHSGQPEGAPSASAQPSEPSSTPAAAAAPADDASKSKASPAVT